ncbi:MAG: carbohydrate ABC transporter substrate-binding protein, partial [Oscillospiraceae bacterium]|nr:carbohydrate ABC transporter substrate-binding protein [Oscillospiraceae bacterium]
MRKLLSLVMVLAMVFSLAAFGGTAFADDEVDITLWTYPIGKWADGATVDELIAGFNEVYPDIHVAVEYLDYTNGNDQVNTAIEGGQAPDVIFKGPERLVANWGAKGLMVDLSDIWTENAEAEVYESIKAACFNAEGALYEYPLCMTAHCMAINKTVFEAADALQYLDLDAHTWTTEGFLNAIAAVYEATGETVGAIYCGGQGGDQGTRALVTNLCGGTYANPEHTQYTYASEENAKALSLLCNQAGITFDPAIVASDEIQNFVNGTFQMAFCWNATQEVNNA